MRRGRQNKTVKRAHVTLAFSPTRIGLGLSLVNSASFTMVAFRRFWLDAYILYIQSCGICVAETALALWLSILHSAPVASGVLSLPRLDHLEPPWNFGLTSLKTLSRRIIFIKHTRFPLATGVFILSDALQLLSSCRLTHSFTFSHHQSALSPSHPGWSG